MQVDGRTCSLIPASRIGKSWKLRFGGFHQPEVPLRPGYIPEDLRSQSFRRGPLSLAAQPEQELDYDGRLIVYVDWLEVEDVRLDGEGRLAEGGAVAYVGDCLERASADREPRDVDPEGWKLSVVSRQVHRRHKKTGADAAPTGLRGANLKGAAQHPARARHVARSHVVSDRGTGNFQIAHPHRRMDVDGKAKLRAKCFELSHSGLGAMSKAEVAAFMQAANSERVHQNAVDKLPRRQEGERRIEGQHHHRVDAGESQQSQALVNGREQPRRGRGVQKLFWMRVEGDGHGLRALQPRDMFTGFANHRRKNLLVAQVHAVEVADGGHGGAKTGRNLRDRMIDRNHSFLSHQSAVSRFTGRLSPS